MIEVDFGHDLQQRKGNIPAQLAHLQNAVEKTGSHRPAMLLADRLNGLGDHEAAIELYAYVMRSRRPDKFVRVTSAMLAGLLTARILNDVRDARTYWNYIIDEFADYRFFALQAGFLNGTLSEESFRKNMGQSADWQAAAEYAVGLDYLLKGDVSSAQQAFESCLKIDTGNKIRNRYSPQTWAREDLRRIRRGAGSND